MVACKGVWYGACNLQKSEELLDREACLADQLAQVAFGQFRVPGDAQAAVWRRSKKGSPRDVSILGHRLPVVLEAFEIELDGLCDVCQRLAAGAALGNTARQ